MSELLSQFVSRRKNDRRTILILSLFIPLLFILDLLLGSVSIPASEVFTILFGGEAEKQTWRLIVLDTRLPQSLTAVFAGAGLAVGGLLLQTFFRNPLAGPDVLGVSSGSMLGVALVFMGFGIFDFSFTGISGNFLLILASFAGAFFVLLLILLFSKVSREPVTVIIAGLMIAYLINALISLLQHAAAREGLQQYVFWGFGNFSGLDLQQSLLFSVLMLVFMLPVYFLVKPLNAWRLGEWYAKSVGINASSFRWNLIVLSGLITATVTAFCGPVAFIGIAVPHLVRLLMKSEDHFLLFPAVALSGALLSLLCSVLTRLPFFEEPLPLNAVTSLIGAPVVIWVILRGNRQKGLVL